MDKESILNKKAHVYLTNKFHFFGEIIEIDNNFICLIDYKTGLKILAKDSIFCMEVENEEK